MWERCFPDSNLWYKSSIIKYDFKKIKKIETIAIKDVEERREFLDFVNVYLSVNKLKYDDNNETIFIHVFNNYF